MKKRNPAAGVSLWISNQGSGFGMNQEEGDAGLGVLVTDEHGHNEVAVFQLFEHGHHALFVNDGEQAASFVIYTPIEAGAISFASDGNLIADIVKYELDTEIDR